MMDELAKGGDLPSFRAAARPVTDLPPLSLPSFPSLPKPDFSSLPSLPKLDAIQAAAEKLQSKLQ
jgi:hypothetical protein